MSEIRIGARFFENFKSYLRQIGVTPEQISQVKEKDAKDVFEKADAADGNIDGKADGEKFLEEIKKQFANIQIDPETEKYLEAWKALAGDDKVLDTEEVAEEDPEEDTKPTGGSPSPKPPKDDDDKNNGGDVSDVNTEGKSSAELRSERDQVVKDIEDTRTLMDEAVKEKQAAVEEKKAAYDELLTQLAEASEIKDENDKSLKDLQNDKTNKEAEISDKKGEIDKTKSEITNKKDEISKLEGELRTLENNKPNKSKFTTTDDEGNTIVDEAAYNAAMAEYMQEKARIESEISAAKDALSQLELNLSDQENQLTELNNGLFEIENQIASLVAKIAKEDTANKELAKSVDQAQEDYAIAINEANEVATPFEAALAKLTANLQAYETAIAEQDKVEAEEKEKEKWTTDVESEKAKEYKDELDKLLVPGEEEKTEETKGDKETEEAKEDKEAKETEETKEDKETKETKETEETKEAEEASDNKVLPEENKKSFMEILQAAIRDENVSLEDKFRLLNYAKGRSEDSIKEMLEDDTFFVNAFNEVAEDENRGAKEAIAMQEAYFDLQGNTEIGSSDKEKDAELKEMYTEGVVTLIDKAAKESTVEDVLSHLEAKNISTETMKEGIKASSVLTAADKEELLKNIDAIPVSKEFKPALDVFTLGLNGDNIDENDNAYSFTVIYPEDVKPGEELDVVFFCPGAAQYGSKFNEKSQFAEDTTVAGQFYSVDPKTGEVTLKDSSEYQNKPRCVYVQMSLTKEGMKWTDEDTSKAAQWVLDNKLQTYGITRGKTVLSGASKGVYGAAELAKTLGDKYFDRVVYISGDPKKDRDVKIPEYGYSAEMGEKDLGKTMAARFGSDHHTVLGGLTEKDGTKTTSKHGTIVDIVFNTDSNKNGIADFFEYDDYEQIFK